MNQGKPIKHLAKYLRISEEKKSENVETLENHRQILTDYCKKNGYTYVEFGEVISGGKSEIEDRPQLQKLLSRIEEFDGILCVELTRISRNGLISQTVKQYCMDYDKPIITPYQIYDLANNENHRLMYDLGSLISSHEHGVIGKRSKMNKIQLAKQGFHISGGVPFGYIRNPKTKKLEIDEDAAKVIRYIFLLHSKGYGSYKIRDILNSEGYKPARSEHWNLPSIKRIIRNETYKGWTFFHDRKRIKKKGKVTHEIQDVIIVKDTHPAIIPQEEWDNANRDRIDRAEHYKAVREKPVIKSEVTMLKDLIYCARCGRKMSVRLDEKSTTGYTVMRCQYLLKNGDMCRNSGIRVVFIEEKIQEELIRFKTKLIQYLKLIEENGSEQAKQEHKHKLMRLNKRLKEVQVQKKDLINLALSKLFTNDEIAEKKQELINLETELELQLETLEEQDVFDIDDKIDKIKEMISLIDDLPNLDPEQVNQALKTFIKKIHYKRLMPENILKLSTRNPERRNFPFEIGIEYYEL